MSQRFKEKTILITGAGSGIGQAASTAFAEEGAVVIGVDRSKEGLAATQKLVEATGVRFAGITADVSSVDSVDDAFEKAAGVTGQIDCAFNNAGITQSSTLAADITPTEWDDVMRINVTGVWLCMRRELQLMQKQGHGAIVNTASFLSTHSMEMQTAYVASKHALLGMTKNTAIEYAAKSIRVNAVAPGGIPTGMMAASLSGLERDAQDAARKAIGDMHPMKRLGTPQEIAQAVLFLCSEQAGFITGACLSVDGGWAAL